MIILILSIIVIVISMSMTDKNREARDFKRAGGLKAFYPNVILYYSAIPDAIIQKYSGNELQILINAKSHIHWNVGLGKTTIKIKYEFNSLKIKWIFSSLTNGDHKLNWDFSHITPEELILSIVQRDIEAYLENILGKEILYLTHEKLSQMEIISNYS